jgi:uncharacterized membrane protein YkoI
MLAFLLSAPSAAGAQECLSSAETREAVSSGEAAPLSRVARELTERYGGQIVRADLCRQGGGLVYRVTVLGERGEVHNAVVDAATGQIAGGG